MRTDLRAEDSSSAPFVHSDRIDQVKSSDSTADTSAKARPSTRGIQGMSVILAWTNAAALTVLLVTLGRMVDRGIDGHAPTMTDAAILAAFIVVVAAVTTATPWLSATAQGEVEVHTRRQVLNQIFRLGLVRRTQADTGRVVSTATDAVERDSGLRATFVGPMIGSATVPLIVLGILALTIDPYSAAWLLLAVPFIPLVLGGFQAAFRKVSGEYRASSRGLSATFLNAAQGLPTLTLFNRAEAHAAVVGEAAELVRQRVMRLLAGNQLVIFVSDAVFSLGMITLASLLAAWRLEDGVITPGQALALVLASTLLTEPLNKIGEFFYIGMGGRAATKEIAALLEKTPEVRDAAGAISPERMAKDAQLDAVTFGYGDGPAILQDFSMTVPAGQQLALVGPSGAGKSTIAALLQAQYRPHEGRVLLGGHDLNSVTLQWIRANITVVAQTTYLFTGTIADNLRVAKPDATRDELHRALEAAALTEMVAALPAGVDTQVGERGASVSGGQAQRLAIARALLKDAPILVLDEPTSDLDSESERRFVEALAAVTEDRTVLVISHRPTTIAQVDEVITVNRPAATEKDPS